MEVISLVAREVPVVLCKMRLKCAAASGTWGDLANNQLAFDTISEPLQTLCYRLKISSRW
jgi:hypothetical protein